MVWYGMVMDLQYDVTMNHHTAIIHFSRCTKQQQNSVLFYKLVKNSSTRNRQIPPCLRQILENMHCQITAAKVRLFEISLDMYSNSSRSFLKHRRKDKLRNLFDVTQR